MRRLGIAQKADLNLARAALAVELLERTARHERRLNTLGAYQGPYTATHGPERS
jgi:hypothetical protein